nr:hypothetical protein [Tanacetum cinerariifolium]
MQIPKELITNSIRNAPYYNAYLEMFAKHDHKIAAKEGGKKKSASKVDQSKKPRTAKQPKPLSSKQSKPTPAKQPKHVKEKSTKPSPIKKATKGKGRKVRKEKSSLQLDEEPEPTPEPQRRILVTEEASTRPSAQPEDDTSANIVRDTPSHIDAKTGVKTDKMNSEGDTEILNIALEQVCANFEKRHKLQDKNVQGLSSRIFILELRDLHHKINQTVNEVVKELFMKLSRHLWTVITRTSSLKHLKSRKRRCDNQYPPPPLRDLDQGKKKRHDSNASASHQPQAQIPSVWMTIDTRDVPSSSSKKMTTSQSGQPVEDVPILNDVHFSGTKDTDTAHLLNIKPRPDWLKPIPEEERQETPNSDRVVTPNDLPEPENNWIGKSKLSKANLEGLAYKDLEYLVSNSKERRSALSISKLKVANYPDFRLEKLIPSLWIESKQEYVISATHGISHCWFKCKEFYIARHSTPSDRPTVISHMRILSVVSLKTISRYGYTYLKEIVLRIADYNEYKISESNFKNLHPNDFEYMYLLHLQGKLNHLFRSDKVKMFNAVNIWIRNIVIRKQVEDLQLGIESYQTKINLTELNWDAYDFLFKEDYTVISKPRAVIYRDRMIERR